MFSQCAARKEEEGMEEDDLEGKALTADKAGTFWF